ncbi:Retroelement pol Polyprotein [Phytophthora megakarya]|uniref:Retroelement pol Polyprotein n=1 Tax=Phytophthora megakarya TaxID=4795 RepID=A0A225VH06_9STRA|nr:Retroelement pol Polyprotein [Phytophthora megakarya]
MVSNLTGQAAAWYITQQHEIADITALAAALRREFIPPDLQERLRDSLYQLKQRECRDLHEYVTKYRQLISRVKEMGELDKITLFTRGLVSQTRAEVVYRRCSTVHEAVNVAMEYERAHPTHLHGSRGFSRSAFQRANENRGFGGFGRNPNRASTRESQPEPMDIGRNLCFFCKEPGHRMAQCRKRNGQRGPPRQQQSYQRQRDTRTPRGNDSATAAPSHRVHSYEEKEPEVETELFERLTIKAAVIRSSADQDQELKTHQLLVKEGTVNGTPVKILLDSGADHNVLRKGLATQVVRRKKAIAERFDGSVTDAQWVNEVQADMMFDGGYRLEGMLFSEWDLPATHDVILGKPWFSRFNPNINWRTHEVVLDLDLLDPLAEEAEAAGLTTCNMFGTQDDYPDDEDNGNSGSDVTVSAACIGSSTTAPASTSPAPTPPAIERMLSNYADCFPTELPNELPVSRPVEFSLTMKADANPSSRAPFRLSKTEQDALRLFVDELLRKQWIEVSDSPWVSSIFAVPKKDPTTGKALSRADWLRSGNSSLPTEIPKIPLPRIEDLFDRMQGCRFFSTLDLAQGYHQMLVDPSSRKYTAFRTDTETYQWCAAPMGLAGMPGVWSRLMRLLFGSLDFVVVYLDDLCIFSRTELEHIAHVAATVYA